MTTPEIVKWVIEHFEGFKYTDDPVDLGGATKFGITLRTLQYYRRLITNNPTLIITKTDVKNLTIEEAIACGVYIFAQEPKIDQLNNWKLQLFVYDYGYHSGQPRAIKSLQKALGLSEDGKLGPITIKTANGYPFDDIYIPLHVLTAREGFMQRIMEVNLTQRKYMLGWWKRTTELQRILVS